LIFNKHHEPCKMHDTLILLPIIIPVHSTGEAKHQNVPKGTRASILRRCYTYIAPDGARDKMEFNIPHFGYQRFRSVSMPLYC
jgi:hypothetical protein